MSELNGKTDAPVTMAQVEKLISERIARINTEMVKGIETLNKAIGAHVQTVNTTLERLAGALELLRVRAKPDAKTGKTPEALQ